MKAARPTSLRRKLLRAALSSFVLAVLATVALALWPLPLVLEGPGTPPADYAAARAQASALLENPPPAVRPECRSAILDHGHRTRDVYVLLHGLTNCPAQFRQFADQLHSRGANVLMLRLPYHGLADRMSEEPARLTARDMVESANLAVNLAHGYGERVIVIGLSVSGVTAAWLAQERTDIDLAVIIAPFFAPAGLPDIAIRPLATLLRRLPNSFVWWDPGKREALPGSPFSYPRFATRSIGETMALGVEVFQRARTSPPRAGKILLVTSPTDPAIALGRVRELATIWGPRATPLAFPADWKVPHDCIDPAQPGARIDLVYPRLVAWIDAALR